MPSHAKIFQIHEQGRVPCTPTTRHSKAQQGASLLPASQHFEGGRKTHGDKRLSCPSHSTHWEMANHNSMHVGQACRKTKTNKLNSTSEVTLQDSNLEVYWQRGKRPGLVHGRDALTEYPQLGTGPTPGQTGGVTPGDHWTPTPRLASSDISLFRSLYLSEQVDTPLLFNKNIR